MRRSNTPVLYRKNETITNISVDKFGIIRISNFMASRAQIIVTLGPASEKREIFLEMARHQADGERH